MSDPAASSSPSDPAAAVPPRTQRVERPFVFPRWANFLLPVLVVALLGGALYVPTLAGMALNPTTINVGYEPNQPIAYSHALHVGELGMDCRYCHTSVDNASFAAIPPTQSCMNCHHAVMPNSPEVRKLQESWTTGNPIEWVKVHDLPDFAFFNHAAHVNNGVGCYSCHGRIDQMVEVSLAQPLSMAWCLDCHREPEKFLRPREQVTSMTYHLGIGPDDLQVQEGESLADAQLREGRRLKELYGIKNAAYMQACSTCHR